MSNTPDRMKVDRHPLTMTPSSDGPSNKYDGLHTVPVENHSDVDVKAIPPNGERPIETTPTRHLFGNFSD